MEYLIIIFVAAIIIFFTVCKILDLGKSLVFVRKQLGEKTDAFDELNTQMKVLENAISEKVLSRLSEQDEPYPSGAYQALFRPSGRGGIMSIYMCLETGHVARWHYPNADVLENEGRRMLATAQAVREHKLREDQVPFNVPVSGSKMIH